MTANRRDTSAFNPPPVQAPTTASPGLVNTPAFDDARATLRRAAMIVVLCTALVWVFAAKILK